MSKEELLLGEVLDRFSNIREVVNATKDIENYLIKLKLNKKKGIGVILEKTKSLVDSLFDHSVKVKDEFYQYYNQLSDSEKYLENCESASKDSNINESEANCDVSVENHKKGVSGDRLKSKNNKNVEKDKLIEDDEVASTTEDDKVDSSTKNNKNVEKDKLVETDGVARTTEDDEVDSSTKNSKNVEKDKLVEDGVASTTEDDEVDSSAETDKENSIKDKIDDAAEANSMENDENLISAENRLEKDSSNTGEKNGEVIINEKNDPKSNVEEDPLKDVEDTDIADNLNNNKENADNDDQHSSDSEETNAEELPKIKEEDKPFEPKIRLVDLSKLIDPKPRKSVKFDSSVIILTSSDEESKSPKKFEQNGVLKSALKNSPNKVYNSENIDAKSRNKVNKENEKEASRKRSRQTRRANISYKKKESSSDSDVQVVSTHKTKSANEGNIKKQNSHSKKNEDVTSDSEDDMCKRKNSTKKESKTKVSFKDITKSLSSDESEDTLKKKDETKNKKKQESDQEIDLDEKESGRKSSRLNKQQKLKEKERVRLRTIFSRNSTKSGKYNYRIVSEKNKDSSDSESESENSKKKKSSRKEKDLVEEHLSDTSSLSGDEKVKEKVVKRKQKSKKEERVEEAKRMDVDDKKFTYKVYVPLPKIKCHRLKDIYINNKEILEIKSLAKNVPTAKTSKRSHKGKTNSNSSSDSDKPTKKKSKTVQSKKTDPTDDEQSSDDEPVNTLEKEQETEKSKDANPLGKEDDLMADIIMGGLKDKDEEKKSEEDNSSSSDSDSEKTKAKKSLALDKDKNNKDKNNKTSDSEEEAKDNEEENKKSNNSESEEEEKGDKDNEKKGDSDNTDSEGERKDKDDKKKSDNTDSEEEEEKKKKDKRKKKNSNDSDTDEEDKSKDKDKKTLDSTDSEEEEEKKKDKKKKKKSDDSNTDEEDKSKDKSDDDKDSDAEKEKDKKKWRKDKLLTIRIDSTDSDEEFEKFSKKKDDRSKKLDRKAKRRIKAVVSSDSDKSTKSNEGSDFSEEEKSSSDSDENEKEGKETKKPSRGRIKRTRDSSSDDEDKSTRKNIRKVLGREELSETTKQAEAEEKERKARIAEKQKKYNQMFQEQSDSNVEKVVLDYDEKEKKELLAVSKKLVKKLKPHQASGIQFMWNATFESLERAKTTKGSGCILAHCMGLGKTLQVIALTHTLLTNSEETKVSRVLVVCPVNTVLNWKGEFKKWIPNASFDVYDLISCKQNYEKQYQVKEWHSDGGVMIIGYHMFRNLSNPDNKRISKKLRETFQKGFVDPGPDLVICDEGHLLKNEKTNLSIAMNRIKTARRVVLTGTPLQNNLKEYWCMVQFIKPNLLGTYKEYLNRFVNPIINGQYTDSTQHDILVMRKRSHVLHKLLDGVVQRKDYSVLEPYLPPKHEYVLFIALTEVQVKLYKYYMDKYARQNDGSNRTSFLFKDFQRLQRICTHPRVLGDTSSDKKEKDDDEEESEGSLKDFIDDEDESTSSSSSGSDSDSKSNESDDSKKKSRKQQKTRITRALAAVRRENNEDSDLEIVETSRKEWWREFCDGDELDNINNSGKLFLLFQILKECEDIGDKVLVFSQSLFTLKCIEDFLEKIDEATQAGTPEKVGGYTGSWSIGLDYFRLDGSSSCENRAAWCDSFNNPDNTRARLFLISTRAGGLGINLVAANRVIIFDVSWNPSHDIQSIYRVYRFGQTKPCYIYRFVTYGTMEMKIYERQVTKQAISKRVIDEQQIDRHYNQNDLQELYQCDLEPEERPIPMVPKDVLLGELLQKFDKVLYRYHLHQSLLENKENEVLNEEERKAAWEEFENEKVLRKTQNSVTPGVGNFNNFPMNAHTVAAALTNIVRKDNPTWSEVQIKGIIPALVQQLQVQLADGDTTMYTRVQQELQIMQALQAQRMKEALFQQQVLRMIQQQQQQAKLLGNLNVNPAQLANMHANRYNNSELMNRLAGPSSTARRPTNDVIELND